MQAEAQIESKATSLFRDAEKKYRPQFIQRRKRKVLVPCDLSGVIDFRDPKQAHEDVSEITPSDSSRLPPSSRIFGLKAVPGFFVISQALDARGQLHWATQALVRFSNAEHTNV